MTLNRKTLLTSLTLFVVTLTIYGSISYKELFSQSPFPHFVYQAQSFLRGKLYLEKSLPETAHYGEKEYVVQPPVPSLLMLPAVALFGDRLNDVIFVLLLGVFNAVLFYLTLLRYKEKGEISLSDPEILWLVTFFAFGTVHFYASLRGRVWFTNQIVATTMTLAYLCLVSDTQKPFLAGLFCFLALGSRTPLAIGAMLYPLLCLRKGGWTMTELARNLFFFFLPLGVLGTGLMLFNYFRFYDPFEFGYSYFVGRPLFGLQFIKQNFYDTYLRFPLIQREFPYFYFRGEGLSFFLVMPGFLSLLFIRKVTWRIGAFLVTAFSIAFFTLLYKYAGYFQFGPRYTLDFIPYLLLALSLGLVHLNRWTKFLFLLSMGYNTWGAIVFPYGIWQTNPSFWSENFSKTILYQLFFR